MGATEQDLTVKIDCCYAGKRAIHREVGYVRCSRPMNSGRNVYCPISKCLNGCLDKKERIEEKTEGEVEKIVEGIFDNLS